MKADWNNNLINGNWQDNAQMSSQAESKSNLKSKKSGPEAGVFLLDWTEGEASTKYPSTAPTTVPQLNISVM